MVRFGSALPVLVLLCLAVSSGCEDEKHENPFSSCGNSVCDSGEECDDGPVTGGQPSDRDRCLSTCMFNRCGDGFLNENPSPPGNQVCTEVPADVLEVEECDPGDIGQVIQCADLGLSGDLASCGADCRIDTSTCGAPFTPAPTATTAPTLTITPIPSSTPTFSGPSPTVTPTPLDTCGNGVVDAGESCDDGGVCDGGENDGLVCTLNTTEQRCIGGTAQGQPCGSAVDCPNGGVCPVGCTDGSCVLGQNDECPAGCVIEACTPAVSTRPFRVDLSVPDVEAATSVTFFVDYPEASVVLPGSGIAPSVRQRLFFGTCDTAGGEFCERNADCPASADCIRPSVSVIANDFDHAIRVVVTATAGVPEEPSFFIEFDDCSGATPPPIANFGCVIQGCAGEFGLIDGCECSVVEP